MAWSDTDQGSVWVYVATISLFALGAGLGAFVILPRMPHGGNGVIFWEDIRTYPTVVAYQEKLRSLSDQDVEDSYAYQNFYVSRVLHEKHRYLRLAIFLTALGAAMAVMNYWWRASSLARRSRLPCRSTPSLHRARSCSRRRCRRSLRQQAPSSPRWRRMFFASTRGR